MTKKLVSWDDVALTLPTAVNDKLAAMFDALGAATTAQGAAATDATNKVAAEAVIARAAEGLKLAIASNLADLANTTAARLNLGLGTAATHATGDYDAAGAAAAVTPATLGLGSVDNTADSAKPVSTAQQTALNLKLDTATASSTYLTALNGAPRAIAAGSSPSQAAGNGRFVGVTAAGPPTIGTYQVADWTADLIGNTYVCVKPGTPGKWSHPGSAAFTPTALDWDNRGMASDVKELGGVLGSPAAVYRSRAHAMAFPIPAGRTLKNVYIHVTGAGEAGSVYRCGIFADDQGFPGALIADLGTVVGDSTGWKTFSASPEVSGGRFVHVALTPQNCPTTVPATSRFISVPYHPISDSSDNADWSTGGVANYSEITGAYPSVWPGGRGALVQPAAPYFNVKLGTDTAAAALGLPDRMPVMFATETWEQNTVMEPNVYWDAPNTRWVMLYSGGWAAERLAWATAPGIDGPWTKQGQLAFGSGRSCVLFDGGTMYVYSDGQVCSGPDIEHLGAQSTALALTGGLTAVTNASVIKDGSTYRMIFDGHGTGDGGNWKSGYATATSPLGPFTLNTFPLDLGLTMDGGPCLTKVGAVFNLWFHGGAGNLPNDIYHATSTDCVTWTTTGPLIVRDGIYEIDQCADPFYVTDPATGTGYLFWSAMNNLGAGSPEAVIYRSVPQTMAITP